MSEYRPRVRQDLLTTEVADEIVLYDCQSHQAHSLSPVAASVWRLADGTRTAEEIAQRAGMAADQHGGEMVHKALAELAEKGLMEPVAAPQRLQESRRRVLRRAAGMAVAPLVLTLAAPSPADAASTAPLRNGTEGDFQPVQDTEPVQNPDIQDPPKNDNPQEPVNTDQPVGDPPANDPPANDPPANDPPVGDPPKPTPNNPPLNDRPGDPPGTNPPGGNVIELNPKGRRVRRRRRRRPNGLGGGATPAPTPGGLRTNNNKANGIER